MEKILLLLKNQLIGTVVIATPAVFVALAAPNLFNKWYGLMFIILLIGGYVTFSNYQAGKNMNRTLLFSPSGAYCDELHQLMHTCNIDPRTINVRYAYTQEAIALASFNTLIIDPLFWHVEDKQVTAAQLVLEQQLLPTLSDATKNNIKKIHALLTQPVQKFIIKHELGHIRDNFSYKKLISIFITGTISACVAIFIALAFFKLTGIGFLAILLGILVGGIADLGTTFLSNFFFKVQQEKVADLFAIKHSSSQEIRAAAEFFEQIDVIFQEEKNKNFLHYIPNEFLTGHPSGQKRAVYLRTYADKKELIK